MALKDDYLNGGTGLQTQMANAFAAGEALVGTQAGEGQYNAISAGLQSNAALGNRAFTVTIPVTYNPSALRNNNGNNQILKSFLAGVGQGLAASSIYPHECVPSLNTTDTVSTSVDLKFSF
jgi:hypothetical protein